MFFLFIFADRRRSITLFPFRFDRGTKSPLLLGHNRLNRQPMMTGFELDCCLAALRLMPAEAARLLSVSPKTVRRWAENAAEIPGPAEQALRAWEELESLGIPWRPDGVDVLCQDAKDLAEQIAKFRAHAVDIATVLERVKQRGGPSAPWRVELDKCRAKLGPIEVTFYRLPNGSFSPASYSRRDQRPDPRRDWPLIEDAFACIATAIAKVGPGWINERGN